MSNASRVSPAQDRQGGSEDQHDDQQTFHLLVSHFPCVKETRSWPEWRDVSMLPVKPADSPSPVHGSVCSAGRGVPGMPAVGQSSRQPPAPPACLDLQHYLACSGRACFTLWHQHVLCCRQSKCATRTCNTRFLHLSTSGG